MSAVVKIIDYYHYVREKQYAFTFWCKKTGIPISIKSSVKFIQVIICGKKNEFQSASVRKLGSKVMDAVLNQNLNKFSWHYGIHILSMFSQSPCQIDS